MISRRVVYRVHAIQRMFSRGISADDVHRVLATGEVVENYPDDRPYPSRLLLGWSGARPLHLVAAYNPEANEEIVITVYEPDPGMWGKDFKKRGKE
jgi:hypothetical protein